MLHFTPFKWCMHIVLLTVIVQNARGFSLNSRRSRSAFENENFRFQPTPNLGKSIELNHFSSHFLYNFNFPIWIFGFYSIKSIRSSSKNAIHAHRAFIVFPAFNVRLMFAWTPMKNHKFAIYHMVATAIAAQPVEILQAPVSKSIFRTFKLYGTIHFSSLKQMKNAKRTQRRAEVQYPMLQTI